jgi:hypothetical protein
MSVDEYEAIRLIDAQGDTQEERAEHMNVSRSRVQSIYDSARKKLAASLAYGKRCGSKAANIVYATVCRADAAALDAGGIAAGRDFPANLGGKHCSKQ